MSAILVTMPFQVFKDNDGNPLESGYVYIGKENLNPITTPIAVYWDEAMTIPAAQPLRTTNGFLSRNGRPANIFTAQNYSVLVQDRAGGLLYSSLNTPTSITEGSLPWVDASAYGSSKNDTTITAAMAYASTAFGASAKYALLIKRGGWTISGNLTIPENVQLIFENGSVLNIATGVTVTYNGPDIQAPLSKIFSLSGTGVFVFGGPVKEVYPQWWGAVGDGTTACELSFQQCVNCCIQNSVAMYIPSGTYILKTATGDNDQSGTLSAIRMDHLTADGQGLIMRGAGRGNTIIKEFDGENAIGGRYTRMFLCLMSATSYELGTFSFEDITFDKNATSNGAPPTLYAWETSHIIAFSGNAGAPSVSALSFNRLEFIDKVAGCIVAGPSTVDIESITINDIQSFDHPAVIAGTIGQKGCIEIAGDVYNGVISAVNCIYSQIEPTYSSLSTRERRYKVSDSKIDTFEYTDSGFNSTGLSYSFVDAVNLQCKNKFLIRGVHLNLCNSIIKNTLEHYFIEAKITNTEILLPYDSGTYVVTPFYVNTPASWISLGIPSKVTLVNCKFTIDATIVDAATTGSALRANVTSTYVSQMTLIGCEFDARLDSVLNAYSYSGKYILNNCKMAGATTSVTAGTFSTYYSSVELNNCDFSDVSGTYLKTLSPSNNYELKITGSYKADDWSQTFTGSGVGGANQASYFSKPNLYGTAAPSSGTWFLGDRVINTTPVNDGSNMVVHSWVCTTAGTPGTWVAQYLSSVSPAV